MIYYITPKGEAALQQMDEVCAELGIDLNGLWKEERQKDLKRVHRILNKRSAKLPEGQFK